MTALGLSEFADTPPYDLPPALRRLVAVGAVLAMNSDVLVLDEPTAGLDNPSIARLTTLAHDLVAYEAPLTQVLSLPRRSRRRQAAPGQGLLQIGEVFRQIAAQSLPSSAAQGGGRLP